MVNVNPMRNIISPKASNAESNMKITPKNRNTIPYKRTVVRDDDPKTTTTDDPKDAASQSP